MRYITIDNDRYGGVYSGCYFTAWEGNKPEDVDAGDGTCEEFWAGDVPAHGKGGSRQEALIDFLTTTDQWIGAFDLVHVSETGQNEDRFLIIQTDRFLQWCPECGRDD